jgi:hypothetical protein
MKDLSSTTMIHTKGVLFVGLGLMSAAVLIAQDPSWTTVLMLTVCIWAFARAYYYAFYVVQRYVDPQFKFSGLIALAAYLLGGDRDHRRGS